LINTFDLSGWVAKTAEAIAVAMMSFILILLVGNSSFGNYLQTRFGGIRVFNNKAQQMLCYFADSQ
jgi:hypothetical protein